MIKTDLDHLKIYNSLYNVKWDSVQSLSPSYCIGSIICNRCKIKCQTNSSPRDFNFNEDKTIRYIWGPCCCGMIYCPECFEELKNMSKLAEDNFNI